MNCVVVDVGNTSTAIGLARDGHVSRISHLQGGLKDNVAIGHLVRGVAADNHIDGAVLCSVVPAVNKVWLRELKRTLQVMPLLVSHKTKLGVEIAYPKPATIGADRLANACGAVTRYGFPVIVADFGTALTFDVVSADNKYIGGVIAPGLPVMTDYLSEKTALLPRIKLKGAVSAVGRSTKGAMRIGAHIGYRGMVREIVEHIEGEIGKQNVKLCATGGYAKWALDGLNMSFTFDSDLTLYGLSRIFALNS